MGIPIDIDMAFERAFSLHVSHKLEEAELAYRDLLKEVPDEPNALHFLGILFHQQGLSDQALPLIIRSITLVPDAAEWRNDLGNILVQRGEPNDAEIQFRAAIRLQPDNQIFWNNLGMVLQTLNQLQEAQEAYQQALYIEENFEHALVNLGNLLEAQGMEVEAAKLHCRAFVLQPTDDKPKSMLAKAYYILEEYNKAAEVYRTWLMEEPENPIPLFLLAACSSENIPVRATNGFLEQGFDAFAENFDMNLHKLGYCGPAMIGESLNTHIKANKNLTILDAGCGTGLCASELAPYSKRIIGVDISSNMLEKADQRQLYDQLVKCELGDYLSIHPNSFDLIVAADTINYFGALEDIFSLTFSALISGGWFIFTTELDTQHASFWLNPHGRYSHNRNYLQLSLIQAGFEIVEIKNGILRVEFGKPVASLTITARRKDY